MPDSRLQLLFPGQIRLPSAGPDGGSPQPPSSCGNPFPPRKPPPPACGSPSRPGPARSLTHPFPLPNQKSKINYHQSSIKPPFVCHTMCSANLRMLVSLDTFDDRKPFPKHGSCPTPKQSYPSPTTFIIFNRSVAKIRPFSSPDMRRSPLDNQRIPSKLLTEIAPRYGIRISIRRWANKDCWARIKHYSTLQP